MWFLRYELEKIGKKHVFWALAPSGWGYNDWGWLAGGTLGVLSGWLAGGTMTINLVLIDIGSWLMAYFEGNT